MKREDGRSKSQLHRGHVESQQTHVDGRKKKKEHGVPTAVEVVFLFSFAATRAES